MKIRSKMLIPVLLTLHLSSFSLAQKPTWSATQNWLDNVSFATCMQRSREALVKNSFRVTAQADNVSFIGENDVYYAFLTCQSCGDKTITTIMLSTYKDLTTTTDLRERMLYYIATGKDARGLSETR